MNIEKRNIIKQHGIWEFIRIKMYIRDIVNLLEKHKLPIQYTEYIIKGEL